MVNTLEEIKRQHIENYRNAILENIKNNTNVLVDEDIMSLLRKPPLDSMDVIKSKFLTLAKKNKIVLDVKVLDRILDDYRKDVVIACEKVKKERNNFLNKLVLDVQFEKETDLIKINKKDFNAMNKKLKKILKEQIKESVEKKIVKNVNLLFTNKSNEEMEKKIQNEFLKYILGPYQRQLLENMDIKILVKDTTLINSIKEQGERYLFTLANSRLFQQEEK